MLGRFMDAYPEHFIATPYLQYVDWALTDQVSGHGKRTAIRRGRGLITNTVLHL